MDESDLAKRYAKETGEDFEEVLSRWDKSPDKIVEDLFQVRDLDTGEVRPLELFYPYQHKALHAYFYGDSTTINVYKGRRIGFSFIFSLAIFLDGLINPGSFFPIVSVKKGTAEKRIEDIYDLIDMCVLDIPLETDNKGEIELWNGTSFEAFSGGVDSDRGADPARTVFIDEMAFLEDQEDTMRVFRPFIALGAEGKFLQVSTPKVDNDLFMDTHNRGTETGWANEHGDAVASDHPDAEDAPISIKQPSFKNAEDIDINTPLPEQGVVPVRPDMDIDIVEDERAQDPEGFAQEYLCRPISDAYRFFPKEGIARAMKRGKASPYVSGWKATKQYGGTFVMGADIAGPGKDDTVLTVWEHCGDSRRGERYLRYWEVVDTEKIEQTPGLPADEQPDSSNGKHLVQRMGYVYNHFGCEHLVYDETGIGQLAKSMIRTKVGRGAHPFNFTDKESVRQMAHDLNYALRNDNVSLMPSKTMAKQLEAVVKEKDEDHQVAKFSGKEYGPEGKDDIAMALILGAYPSVLADDKDKNLHNRDRELDKNYGEHEPSAVDDVKKLFSPTPQRGTSDPQKAFGLAGSGRGRKYNRRHKRGRSRF